MKQDTYAFYRVDLPTLQDLTVLLRIGYGRAEIYVSNTNRYPTRSREGVQWFSLGNDGLNQVDVVTSDPNYKPGAYFISVYAVTDLDFGVAAYLDKPATDLRVGKKYGLQVSTYSYRCGRVWALQTLLMSVCDLVIIEKICPQAFAYTCTSLPYPCLLLADASRVTSTDSKQTCHHGHKMQRNVSQRPRLS
jgi:hypothetical protein